MASSSSLSLVLIFCALGLVADAAPTRQQAPKIPDYELEARRRVEAADRKELVRSAPAGFKPEPVERKLRLKLVPRDKTIRVGQTFWYRLELQNVGRTPVRFRESNSFLKDGKKSGVIFWDFSVEAPGEKRQRMVIGTAELLFSHRPQRPIKVAGSERMTDEEVQDFIRRDAAYREADRDLDVTLGPGETLFSRPWRWVDADEYQERFEKGLELWPRPKGTFRELWTAYEFEKPGRYRIRATLNDPAPPPPGEEVLRMMEAKGYPRKEILADHLKDAREHLGRIESNSVDLKVIP